MSIPGLEGAIDDVVPEDISEMDFDITQGENVVVLVHNHPSLAVNMIERKGLKFYAGNRHLLTFHKKGYISIEEFTRRVKRTAFYRGHMSNRGLHSPHGIKPMLITHKSGLEAYYVPNVELI
jgi:hypothetical protein